MVGERTPDDETGLPRRARRAADPVPEDDQPDPGSAEPTPSARGRRGHSGDDAAAADAADTTVLPRAESRSRSAREARTAAQRNAPAAIDPKAEKQRRRLARERQQVRRDPEQLRDRRPGPLSRARGRLARLPRAARFGGLVAVVVVLALAVTVAVLSLRPGGGPLATGDTPGETGGEDRPLLATGSMLTPEDAKQIADDRSWAVALDQRGRDDSSPSAACVASSPPEGQPAPQQLLVRTLTASGSNPPALLHQAQAYASQEEAVQAFTLIAKAFGDCTLPKAYIADGASVSGVGDQVVALTLRIDESTPQYRTVVVGRTGRVINIVDAAHDREAVRVLPVLKALGLATDAQCTTAVGLCTTVPKVAAGPPPLGGDEPGFLATADLPPADDSADGQWNALPTSTPAPTSSSGCEGVDLTATPAQSRVARTYLWSKTPSQSPFGLDDLVLTLESEKDARTLADRLGGNIKDCKKRQLTATTSDYTTVSGTGAARSAVSGVVATINQKTADATLRYRVAVVRVDTKVVYLFLPTESKLDVSTDQWKTLAVRAGQRASQIQ